MKTFNCTAIPPNVPDSIIIELYIYIYIVAWLAVSLSSQKVKVLAKRKSAKGKYLYILPAVTRRPRVDASC